MPTLNTTLFCQASHLYVAFSGGSDSSVLLHILCEMRNSGQLPQSLSAVHIHHGLHADADYWEQHCRDICEQWQVPLKVFRVRVPTRGASAENRARKARYAAWEEMLDEGTALLLAHHADDQVETVLMRLLRGAGPAGLAGMPVSRNLGAGMLARPLLHLHRAELAQYAAAHKLSWVEDPDNANSKHDRNFIRHSVLPLLQQRWRGATSSILKSASIAGETQHLCDWLAAADLARVRAVDDRLQVDLLAALPSVRQTLLIIRWCRDLGVSPPPMRRLSRLNDLLSAAPDRSPELCWRDTDQRLLRVRRYREHLYLLNPEPPLPESVQWDPVAQSYLSLPHGELSAHTGRERGINPQRLHGLQVRFRRGGEVVRPAGCGYSKPLRKYLQEMGIPPWLRSSLPLLYTRGDLVAISDLCVCEEFAVPPGGQGLQLRWRATASERGS